MLVQNNKISIAGRFMAAICKKQNLICLSVLIVTFLSFYPSLRGKFTDWDDKVHVVQNLQVRSLSFENIKTIFTSKVIEGYIPLTVVSFAVEYHFFGLNPFVYHLDNLLLHLAVTALVFFFGLRLKLDVLASGLAALLFGIHPMHVESVAWITERKDVLYAAFYMLALHSYWSYLETQKKKFYALTMLCGLLSILAKSMALSLPLILLVLDWKKGRTLMPKVFLEKIPYFIYVIPITWLTYNGGYVHPLNNPPFEALLTWMWASVFYIWKFLFPVLLIPIYTRPEPITLLNPSYAAAVLFLALFILVVIRFRHQQWLIFACSFYFFSIFFLFPFNAFKFNIVNDRYMYLPSVGFCFLFGFLIQQGLIHWQKRRLQRYVAVACVVIVFGALSVKTFVQCQIWKDSLTLFSEIIQHHPENWFAFYQRAKTYEMDKKFDLALKDYGKAILINPDHVKAYNNRGAILLSLGRDNDALEDLTKVIRLDPNIAEAYSNRSVIYARRHQYDLAIADLNKALELKPTLNNARVRLEKMKADGSLLRSYVPSK